ncbi:MAG: type VI secretion system contractile sheath small subunit [Labilithrix sp.]|nr:type VI secretion system contractile sheath small subunit [Labilithrix sp.]MCW5811438.1 type VI secretion system contractile sheath small subunit [Labilithrix sp.]
MANEGSVAPPERINIKYKPSTGDAKEEIELPLKMLFLGDYTGRPDPRALEDRKPINIDKDNFDQVLGEQKLELNMAVNETMSGNEGASLNVNLKFKKLSDFGPEAVAQQVPELKKMIELRETLTALKGPLGNTPAFRRKIQDLLADNAKRDQLMKELGLGDEPKAGG